MAENNTHTHPFNGCLSGTTQVSWYQKGKTKLDFTEARDSEWQWHHIISYQGFLVRPLLREPRPQVHYKSQPDATAGPYASLHIAPDR